MDLETTLGSLVIAFLFWIFMPHNRSAEENELKLLKDAKNEHTNLFTIDGDEEKGLCFIRKTWVYNENDPQEDIVILNSIKPFFKECDFYFARKKITMIDIDEKIKEVEQAIVSTKQRQKESEIESKLKQQQRDNLIERRKAEGLPY